MPTVIAVTGATGLTGRFLVGELESRGDCERIRCLVRPTSNTAGLASSSRELLVGDCMNPSSLDELVKQVDAVVHVAGISMVRNVINACIANQVARLIVVGSTGIFSTHRRGVAERLSLEESLRASGLEYTLIRPTMIYGNQRDGNIRKLVKIINRYPVVPVFGSNALLQPIYARDLAVAIAASVFNRNSIGKEYNVAGRSPVQYGDMLRLIADALGKTRVFIPVPYSIAVLGGYVGEVMNSKLISRDKILRLLEDRVFDYNLATTDLGFDPLSFEEGVKLEVAALREARVI